MGSLSLRMTDKNDPSCEMLEQTHNGPSVRIRMKVVVSCVGQCDLPGSSDLTFPM